LVAADHPPLWHQSIACQAGTADTSAVIMLKSVLCTENLRVTVFTRCNNKDS